MQELVTAGSTALNPFAAYAETASSANTLRGDLLKFTKGRWTAGQSNSKIADGTTYTVDMNEVLVGWQRWWDRKVTGATMGTVASGFRAPQRHTLGDSDESEWQTDDDGKRIDPWQLTSIVYLNDGSDEYTFSTSSHGGRNAIADLCKQYGAEMASHPAGAKPIVAIGTDEYEHKKYGLTFVPTLKIVGWADDGERPAVAAPVTAAKAKTKF